MSTKRVLKIFVVLKSHIKNKKGRLRTKEESIKCARDVVKIQCHLGHTWETQIRNVIYSDSWCPECYKKTSREKQK